MIPRLHLTTLIGVAAVIWGIFLLAAGYPLTRYLFDPFSKVIGVLVIVLFLFDRWLWKLPIIHSLLVPFPDVSGTWKGQINSSWKNEKTGNPIETIDAFLVVYQTYSSINIRMMTKESNSDLLSGNIIQNQAGPDTIAGVYNNIPYLTVREKSPIHFGGLLLKIHNGEKTILDGEYWTDRDTKGTLLFDKRMKKTCENFDSALSLLQNSKYQKP